MHALTTLFLHDIHRGQGPTSLFQLTEPTRSLWPLLLCHAYTCSQQSDLCSCRSASGTTILIHTDTHSHTHGSKLWGAGRIIRSNLGFSVLPEDASTCGSEELRQPALFLVDDLLLSHSHPRCGRHDQSLSNIMILFYPLSFSNVTERSQMLSRKVELGVKVYSFIIWHFPCTIL